MNPTTPPDPFDHIPMIDLSDPQGQADLLFEISSTGASSDYRNDRERPYNGQPWTDHGERGKTLVQGLTIRDICDCIVQGFLAASGTSLNYKTFPLIGDVSQFYTSDWRYSDLYQVPDSIDPQAVIQNTACFIEHYMGIFPNVPGQVQAEVREQLRALGEEASPPEDSV